MDQEPVAYPLVSIIYCVKCNWVLRAAWYQQELLQTFTSKANTAEEAHINSVILRPSFVAGTFRVYVKRSEFDDWVIAWDRTEKGGFPEAKVLKQAIRDIVSPQTDLGHSDKLAIDGVLISKTASPTTATSGEPTKAIPISRPQPQRTPSRAEIEAYGSPKLAASHKTFCEECVENLPPTWEL